MTPDPQQGSQIVMGSKSVALSGKMRVRRWIGAVRRGGALSDRGRQSARLLNGDRVTPSAFGACMGRIDERLERIEGVPERWLIVGVALIVVLIVAQVGTPFLNAAHDSRRAVGSFLTHFLTPS